MRAPKSVISRSTSCSIDVGELAIAVMHAKKKKKKKKLSRAGLHGTAGQAYSTTSVH